VVADAEEKRFMKVQTVEANRAVVKWRTPPELSGGCLHIIAEDPSALSSRFPAC
jgi:hypothetical protein